MFFAALTSRFVSANTESVALDFSENALPGAVLKMRCLYESLPAAAACVERMV